MTKFAHNLSPLCRPWATCSVATDEFSANCHISSNLRVADPSRLPLPPTLPRFINFSMLEFDTLTMRLTLSWDVIFHYYSNSFLAKYVAYIKIHFNTHSKIFLLNTVLKQTDSCPLNANTFVFYIDLSYFWLTLFFHI